MDVAMNRQRVLLQHLRPNSSVSSSNYESAPLSVNFNLFSSELFCYASICAAGDSAAAYHRTAAFGDDVVIVAKRGAFKDTLPDDLLAPVLKVVGTVMAPGSLRATECRMAVFYAGFPGIAAGLESLTVDKLGRSRKINPIVDIFAQARDCLLPMGITSENVAQRYGVESHRHAAVAPASGKFKDKFTIIFYFLVIGYLYHQIVDPKTGEERPVTISVDDGIRPNTNMNDLAKLKPAFKRDGSTTADLLSLDFYKAFCLLHMTVSDGAGAVLLMKRSLAIQKGLPILDVFRSFAASGVDPAVMGVGPASAIPVAVKSAGLELDGIDLFEIIEAFASQYVYCCKKLELDPEKVNANGSAIALGHPLGSTGACCVATLLNEMKRRGRDHRFGVISMCIGSGMGASAVFERGDSVDELCNARTVYSNNLVSNDAK
ncbi:3-ketoacyl-CoA thiolase 2 [Pyrus ussuriensis x Pyrus communis]|uniref:acetyl-CoA C-acyltransferase n=1 Tax=Pyrus ussuriensis x Pyrus communis TaxID=2448454 RepID=A0A5N5FG39_9ROSA|nr:3-ketoacyl-CoA thiolase 2 [Pyrus ussuriensis x Pyrus communis]